MHINKAGLELIKSFEGCRLVAYKCPAGVWTIGYGHTAGVYEGMKITQAQAEDFLKSDMVKYEKYVDLYCGHLNLNENEYSALVSFCYNCGAGNLRTLVNNRNKGQIADALLLYNKAAGKVLKGLVRRRDAERDLFLTGTDSTDTAEYYPACSKYQVGMVAALKSVGETDTSLAHRKKIGAANGITGVGSVASNNKMLTLLKAGKLKRV